jgi:hypothetical protein
MANQDRWRDRDDDRFRDEGGFGGFDYGRGYGGRDYRGSFGESRGDFERGGSSYGRGREFEGGYGGSEYGRGRDFGGGWGSSGGFESGSRGGGYGGGGYESGYRGGGGGGFGRGDFERGASRGGGGYGSSFGGGWSPSGGFESGYRGGGSFGQGSDFDRAYGSSGYAGMRGRGRDWGFGGSPDYGRWDWSRGEDYGRDHGRGGGSERGFWERASDEISSWFGDEEAERRRRQDHHRGRGPKSYTRSDDRIREDINDRLTDDWRVDATHVEVSVSKGEVTLSGTVDSRDAKRRAEDIADSISGVKHVQNNLRVDQSSWTGSSATSTESGFGGASTSSAGTASATGGTGTNLSQTSGTRARRSGT